MILSSLYRKNGGLRGFVTHIPDTQHTNIDMSREKLPQNGGPFKENIANVERIEDLSPLRVVQP